MKKLKKIVLGLIIVFGILLATGVGLGYYFEDDIKRYALQYLSQTIETEVYVEKVEFSLIRKFPKASVIFYDVKIADPIQPGDYVLTAERLYLQFELIRFLKGEYVVNEIDISEAMLNMREDTRGKNYKFWDESKAEAETTQFEIALDKFTFDQVDFTYNNSLRNILIDAVVASASFSGNFSQTDFSLSSKGGLVLNTLHLPDLAYEEIGEVRFDLVTKVSNNRYTLEKGKLQTKGIDFQLTGVMEQKSNSETELDLTGVAKNAAITTIKPYLPRSIQEAIQPYRMSGKMNATVQLEGILSSKHIPNIHADASISGAKFTEENTGAQFHDVGLHVDYTYKQHQQDRLVITDFVGKLGKGQVTGGLTMVDLKKPTIQGSLKCQLPAEELYAFFNQGHLEVKSGMINGDFSGGFTIGDIQNFSPRDLRTLKLDGTLTMDDFSAEWVGEQKNVMIPHLKALMKGNDIQVSELQVTYDRVNEMKMDVNVRNLLPYLFFEEERLQLSGKLQAKQITLESFLSENDDSHQAELNISKNIQADFQVQADGLTFKKFAANQIAMKMQMDKGAVRFTGINLNVAQGKVDGAVSVNPYLDHYLINANATFSRIDMQSFFQAFDNFGQDFITDQHFRGIANLDAKFSSPMQKSLSLTTEKMQVVGNLVINEGRLVNHEAMNETAKFIVGNKLLRPFVKKDELIKAFSDIQFDYLENEIFISNGKVKIPKMEINTSLMDLVFTGEHDFNNQVDYKFNFRLSELFKVGKPQDDEFGPIKDDGTGLRIFMYMRGPADDPKFGLDSKSRKESRKEAIQKEKEEIKQIIKDEFKAKEKEDKIENERDFSIEVEWDEEEKKEQEKEDKRKGKPDKTKKPEEVDQYDMEIEFE